MREVCRCSRCKEYKTDADFSRRKGRKRSSWCKSCNSERRKDWATHNPEKQKAQHAIYNVRCLLGLNKKYAEAVRKRRYGISSDEFNRLMAAQNGACFICGKVQKISLCVDHCHRTKLVRGLLCKKCNTGVGYFYDDPELLEAAAAYLRCNS